MNKRGQIIERDLKKEYDSLKKLKDVKKKRNILFYTFVTIILIVIIASVFALYLYYVNNNSSNDKDNLSNNNNNNNNNINENPNLNIETESPSSPNIKKPTSSINNKTNPKKSSSSSSGSSSSGSSSGGSSSGGDTGTGGGCTPTKTCSDYPGNCDVGLSDGCNNVLDCSNNCTPICEAQGNSTCYYIAVDGSDSNDGTFKNPWHSLNHNNSKLKPGDIVYVMTGVYNEQLKVKSSGNSSNWITYQAYPFGQPIIDGAGIALSWDGLIEISNKSYVRIKGFRVRNGRNGTIAGIFILDNSHDIEILNNTISNTSMSGILVGEGTSSADELNSNITVKYNEIFDTNHKISQEALSICNVNNFEIAYNLVHDTFKEGIDIKCSSSNGTIHNNIVHHIPGSEIYLDANPIYNISIYSNYLYDEQWNGPGEGTSWPGFYRWTPGISLNSEHGSTMDYVWVYNNIVDNVSYYSFTIENSNHLPSTKLRHIKVYNNDFERSYCTGCDNIMITAWANNTEDIEIMNNILWRRVQYDSWGMSIGSVENISKYDINIHNNLYEYYYGWNNVTGVFDGPFYGNNNVILNKGKNVSFILGQDPILGQVETYKVNSSSESIDNGSVVDLNVDYFGNPRPQGNSYDIGAYEFSVCRDDSCGGSCGSCDSGETCINNICTHICEAKGNSTCYYVAVDGNDSNNGTFEKPFKTFYQALIRVKPGDFIYARGGTYTLDNAMVEGTGFDFINNVSNCPADEIAVDGYCHYDIYSYISIGSFNGWASPSHYPVYSVHGGTLGMPITIKAYPGQTPYFTAPSGISNGTLQALNPLGYYQGIWYYANTIGNFIKIGNSYWNIQGFDMNGSYVTGDSLIYMGHGANNITINNNTFHDFVVWGGGGNNVGLVKVDRNDNGGADDINIINNTFHDMSASSNPGVWHGVADAQHYGAIAEVSCETYFDYNCGGNRAINIINNTFYNLPNVFFFKNPTHGPITINNNVMHHADNLALQVNAANVNFIHNLIYNITLGWQQSVGAGGTYSYVNSNNTIGMFSITSQNLTFKYNTFVGINWFMRVFIGEGANISNNIFFGLTGNVKNAGYSTNAYITGNDQTNSFGGILVNQTQEQILEASTSDNNCFFPATSDWQFVQTYDKPGLTPVHFNYNKTNIFGYDKNSVIIIENDSRNIFVDPANLDFRLKNFSICPGMGYYSYNNLSINNLDIESSNVNDIYSNGLYTSNPFEAWLRWLRQIFGLSDI